MVKRIILVIITKNVSEMKIRNNYVINIISDITTSIKIRLKNGDDKIIATIGRRISVSIKVIN